jgi:hypothetical protein
MRPPARFGRPSLALECRRWGVWVMLPSAPVAWDLRRLGLLEWLGHFWQSKKCQDLRGCLANLAAEHVEPCSIKEAQLSSNPMRHVGIWVI